MSSDQHLQVAVAVEREPEPGVTLAQAWRALAFMILYSIGAIVALVIVGLVGFIDLNSESLLPIGLATVTVAVMLSLYFHLMRRNSLTFADFGFKRPDRRVRHLLWQIPAVIGVGYGVQELFLGFLNLIGLDTAALGAEDNEIAGIVNLPVPMIVIVVLAITVLAPLWEEVLFRGAFLDGFTRRFGPVIAILLSSALFAAVHMIPLNLVYLFTLGIALALLRRFHKNIWASIILHAVNNGLAVFMIFMPS